MSKTVCHSVDRFLIWISIGEIFAKHGGFWRYLFCFVFTIFFIKLRFHGNHEICLIFMIFIGYAGLVMVSLLRKFQASMCRS